MTRLGSKTNLLTIPSIFAITRPKGRSENDRKGVREINDRKARKAFLRIRVCRRRDDSDSLFRESSDDVVDRTRRGRTVCYQVLKVERRRKKVCRERSHENHEDIMIV